MNPLAEELNGILESTCAWRLLSPMGKRMYFPKGILSQSAEAKEKAKKFNATIGMAVSEGQPMALDAVMARLPGLTKTEAVAYAPTPGVPATRASWKKEMVRKNPSLNGINTSLPVVVPGLTAGISFLSDMFLDEGDCVVVPDMFWPNYRLIMEVRKNAKIAQYKFFTDDNQFNVEGMEKAVLEASKTNKKAILVLNFPNNPTGFTPSNKEAEAIVAALKRVADKGIDLVVISDDAYFGLQYEKDNLRESIFARLANAHNNILAAKVDGQTKEDYVWGFRGGFITFACPGLSDKQYDALVKKLMGVIRSAISSSSAPIQYILAKVMDDPTYISQKEQFSKILEARYNKVRNFIDTHKAPTGFRALPFNSGYFMSFECSGFSAEDLRLKLLNEDGIGTISIQDKWLRVAFSSVDEGNIEALYAAIYKAAESFTK